MAFGGGRRGAVQATSYKEKYDEVAREFWRLQQMEETEEEREYRGLLVQLEQMLADYREELDVLERENQELQSRLENYTDLKERHAALKDEEAKLLALKRDLDSFSRAGERA
jgi:DNA repair exonuclease SbcCD ATPase subunit